MTDLACIRRAVKALARHAHIHMVKKSGAGSPCCICTSSASAANAVVLRVRVWDWFQLGATDVVEAPHEDMKKSYTSFA